MMRVDKVFESGGPTSLGGVQVHAAPSAGPPAGAGCPRLLRVSVERFLQAQNVSDRRRLRR